MKYERFAHIILREGKIKGVMSSKTAARKVLKELKENSVPVYEPTKEIADYMAEVAHEASKWIIESWPICRTMET